MRDTRCKYEVGDIIPKVGSPKDYEYLILADGSTFDTTSYTELAKVFADGKLPNLTDGRFLEGGTNAGQVKGAGVPNITGRLLIEPNIVLNEKNEQNGVFSNGTGALDIEYANCVRCNTPLAGADTHNQDNAVLLNASRSNPIYGSSDTVQPKSYVVKYYICYGG